MADTLPPRFDLVVAVWGAVYRTMFERVTLPTLCAPGNLAALGRLRPTTLWIYAPPADVEQIDVARLRGRLPADVALRVVAVPGIGRGDHAVRNYLDLSACHRVAIETAASAGAALAFIPGDSVWSEGALPALARRLGEGKRAVFMLGTRVTADAFIDRFGADFLETPMWVARCRPRDLVRAALACLHPITRASFIDSPAFTAWPSTLIWPAADGLLVRGFHFHPALVWPRRYGNFVNTIDQDFVVNAIDSRADIHVVTDSDEALQLNLDVENHLPNHLGTAPASVPAIAAWARANADPLHRWLFEGFPVRLHAGDGRGPAWQDSERRSAQCVRDILQGMAVS